MVEAKKKSRETAAQAAAIAAAAVLETAQIAATHGLISSDHDALIRLQGQVEALVGVISSQHNTQLEAIRGVAQTVEKLDSKLAIQNGRVGKLETRWIQGAAVIAFLLVVIPLLLAAASLFQ